MKNKYINLFLIFVLAGLIYVWTLPFEINYFDDFFLLIDNKEKIDNLSQIGEIFSEDVFFSADNFYYRPLLNVSFLLDTLIGGGLIWVYRISNILLHALATYLVLLVLMKLGASLTRARFLSLIYLAHPALVSISAWIPGRNDSLLTVFTLASFLFFLKFLQERNNNNILLMALFFLLALLSKETAIFIPFLFILYLLLINKEKLNRYESFSFIGSFILPIVIWALLRTIAIDASVGTLGFLAQGVIFFSPFLLISLGKFFLPFNLHSFSLLAGNTIIYGLIAMAFLGVAVYLKKIKKNYLAFGLSWFILFLIPATFGISPHLTRQLLLLEHRLYLPFIGLLIILASWQGVFTKNKQLRLGLGVGLIATLSIYSFMRLSPYQNKITYWQDAYNSARGSSLVTKNLASMYLIDGFNEEAETYYQEALELNPYELLVHYNLGLIRISNQEYDLAETEFRQELMVNPLYSQAREGLNQLLIMKKGIR